MSAIVLSCLLAGPPARAAAPPSQETQLPETQLPETRPPSQEDEQTQEEQAGHQQTRRSRFFGSTEVVATRTGGEPGAAGRREVVLTREEIAALPAQTIQDVLALIPGLGLVRRGARGAQGDLNLRGSTFEQAAILVNGVRVASPQTGHHALDLFLPAAAIERIEVVLGPGSAVHGPDAFGGALNIVTGPPAGQVFVRVGSHDLAAGGVAGAIDRGADALWAAAEREVHTGFRNGTEADVNQAAGGWRWARSGRSLEVLMALGERRFGAYSFYSSLFPDELEQTGGELLVLSGSAGLGPTTLSTALRADRHRDLFVLDRARPDWYRNVHHTRGLQLGLSLAGRAEGIDWVAGIEAARDQIDSSNLGRHHRVRTAGYLEAGRLTGRLTGSVQLRLDHQEPWGQVGMLAAGGAWQPAPGWRLRLHHGQSFRAPSFTELYYDSPSRVGSANLAPERGRTTEAGIDHGPWALALFERRAHPMIDFVLDDRGVWQAENLGRVRTRGAELAMALPSHGRLAWQRLGLVALDSRIDVDPERSAYALAHPKLEAAWTGAARLAPGWRGGWTLRFRRPRDRGSWASLDLRLEHRILDSMSLSLDAANLLDRQISELHGVPLPGRWLTLTLVYRPGSSRSTPNPSTPDPSVSEHAGETGDTR